MKIKNVFSLPIILMGLVTVSCQETKTVSLNKSQIAVVDSLSNHWNKENRPGGAIAILKDGDVLYKNVLGYADVSLSKKSTEKTGFQLAQISNSFVAYALLHLAAKTTFSLEDDLATYLPFITKLNADIKVKHLLQHSSGIHDFEVLKNIKGWSDEKPFGLNDAIELIQTQQEVSFVPGTAFSPSRSNLLLATVIIERVSKKSFEDYIEENVFKALQMEDSYVLTSTNQTDSRMAKSYRINEEDTIMTLKSRKETYASINIVSSISDMIKWEVHLQSPSMEDKTIVDTFNSDVQLDNGKTYDVPEGRLTYGQKYIHDERGIPTAMSTGGIDGFASAVFNFPTEKFTTITLSNNGEPYNGYIGMLSAHNIMPEAFTDPTTTDYTTLKTVALRQEYHQKFEGMYWDALGELTREIKIENDTLRYIRSNGYSSALIPLSENKFQLKTDFDDEIYLEFKDENGDISMHYFYGDATPFFFEKYIPREISEDELGDTYDGHYSCDALGVTYVFEATENQLIASNGETEPIQFKYIKNSVFQGNQWFMGSIEFKKDNKGDINGFYVKNDLIRNLWFSKTNGKN